ncbi:MAG TPA: GDP-L-fucose synthase [Alphaproteobacteria bacterium]|nr:GDP-L-fucose synthase [Alphaproteobacteria bacterium]
MTAPLLFPLAGRRVWVAGHRGMVGGALARRLAGMGCAVLTADRAALDLRRQADVEAWLAAARPDAVVLAAATVGGIAANDSRPADFLYDNLMIEANVVEAAHRTGVAKLLLLGSSCIYPRDAAQPIREEALLSGPLEPTNQWYAVAKIAGIKLCQAYRRQHGRDFIAAMPTNLYGPGDNFDLGSGHVLPALMRRIHEAKAAGAPAVTVWGSGTPRREFLHVDDLADACVFLMERYSDEAAINVGTGRDIAIGELAERIAAVAGWRGRFEFDRSKPDGTPVKRLDVGRLSALGWRARIPLEEGLPATYEWFARNAASARGIAP